MTKITLSLIASILALATAGAATPLPLSPQIPNTAPLVIEYDVPTAGSNPYGITVGPDNNLWFTEYQGHKIGRITPQGVITEFPLPSGQTNPSSIIVGPDGALWFGLMGAKALGRITTAGEITIHPFDSGGSWVSDTANGSDGNLWFTVEVGGQVGRMTTAGAANVWGVSPSNGRLYSITAGPDGNMWFTGGVIGSWGDGYVGEISAAGGYTLYHYPTTGDNYGANQILAGPDGAMWFVDKPASRIRRITTEGVFTNEYTTGASSGSLLDLLIGQDGDLWYSAPGSNLIGRISLAGQIKEFPLANDVQPAYLAQTADGSFWFTEIVRNKIGVVKFVRQMFIPNIYKNHPK